MSYKVANVWRDCSICLEAVTDHNQYFLHVKSQHPIDVITEEFKNHYIQQVATDFFIDQPAQPVEWLCGEAVYLPELGIMFGGEDPCCRLWGEHQQQKPEFIFENTTLLDLLLKLRLSGCYPTQPSPAQHEPNTTPQHTIDDDDFNLVKFCSEHIQQARADAAATDKELAQDMLGPIPTTHQPSIDIIKLYAMVDDSSDSEMDPACNEFLNHLFSSCNMYAQPKPADTWTDDGMDDVLFKAADDIEETWNDGMNNALVQATIEVEKEMDQFTFCNGMIMDNPTRENRLNVTQAKKRQWQQQHEALEASKKSRFDVPVNVAGSILEQLLCNDAR